MFVFVTNNNDFPHVDRYNGKDYVLQPGEKQMFPIDAAAHMFGFGRDDKTENLVRLGWANRADDQGVKWLAKFVFTDAKIVEDAAQATVKEEGTAMPMDEPVAQAALAKRQPGRPPLARPIA